MSEGLKNRTNIPARFQQIFPVHLLLVDDRHKEILRDKKQSPTELRWGYTDDGKRMLVQLNATAHHAAIVLETGVPIRVGEHEIRGAVGAMLIGAVEETAKIRLNPEYVKVVPTRCKARGAGWILTCIQPDKGEAKCCQAIEAAVAIAQVDIVGIRLKPGIDPILGSIEAPALRHIQWAQDQSIHYTKDHCVRADGQCQRHNRRSGKAGRFAQHA